MPLLMLGVVLGGLVAVAAGFRPLYAAVGTGIALGVCIMAEVVVALLSLRRRR